MIKLTIHKKGIPNKYVHVNLANVTHMTRYENDMSTTIYFNTQCGDEVDYINVRETPEEVLAGGIVCPNK